MAPCPTMGFSGPPKWIEMVTKKFGKMNENNAEVLGYPVLRQTQIGELEKHRFPGNCVHLTKRTGVI